VNVKPPSEGDETIQPGSGESPDEEITVELESGQVPPASGPGDTVSADKGFEADETIELTPAAARAEAVKNRLESARRSSWEALKVAARWAFYALGYLVALGILGLLIKSSLEAYQVVAATRWETWAASGFCLVVALYGMYRRFHSWRLAGFCALVFALLVVNSALRFSTSDLQAFTLFGQPTEAMLNPAFLLAILALIIGVWTLGRIPVWSRVIASLLLLYCGSAFLYGAMHNVGLEESFLGVDFFAKIPFYYLQPTFFTIQVFFPIALLVLLIRWFLVRREFPQRAQWLLWLALLVILTDVVGFAAMGRNRVPNLLSAVFPPPLGVGEASTTFVDAFGKSVTARITTRDYETHKTDETAEFYSVALSYEGTEGEQRNFNLSVRDRSGRDVLFLGSEDFEFYEDQRLQTPSGVDFELGGVRTGQNVVLVLDHSGSMKNVLDKLKLAAKAFIDLKGRNDKILIIPFSSSPSPQPISDDPAVLKTQVDAISVAGGTGLYKAVLKAYELGEALSGTTTLVVMTDGAAEDKSAANQQALQARLASKKLVVFSVGLGPANSVDVDFLEALAREGGGKFFLTESADELKSIYQAIGAELRSNYSAYYQSSIPPPEIAILTPDDGASLVSDTTIQAQVPNAGQSRLARVEFFVNALKLGEQAGSEAETYEMTLDVGSLELGSHLLRVVATSHTGDSSEASRPIEVEAPVEFGLVRPAPGDSVGNFVPIEAEMLIRSDQELSQFAVHIDGELVGLGTTESLLYTWDSTDAEAGSHTITVIATMSDGQTISDSVEISIEKAMSVRFASPLDGAELSRVTPLELVIENERADNPVVEVDYLLDTQPIASVSESPFRHEWNTHDLESGRQTIRAVARTRSGSSANASIRTAINTGSIVVDLATQAAPAPKGEPEQVRRVFLPPENVEIVIDASNSMWGQLSGGSKIDIAKQVLHNIIGMIPDSTNVAIRVYGNSSSVSQGNCTDTALLQPLSPIDKPVVLAQLSAISPRGKTLIAYSLDQVVVDLEAAQGSSVVLLITDGIESCDGNPIEAARRLHEHGIDTRLHVIGYDVDDEEQLADLLDIAAAGGGKFFKADSSDELQDAIVEAATVDFVAVDEQDRIWLSEKVSPTAHLLRVGTYSLRINVDPPIELDSVQIIAGQTQRFVLEQENKTFRLVADQ
jgi:Mg-chelatase subunit ChlD